MMTKSNHNMHMVDRSPWPLVCSFNIFMMVLSMTLMFHLNILGPLTLSMGLTMLTAFQWWRDVVRESTFQGIHTKLVVVNMKWGMILFICSEVLFFFSFFWAFFHSSLSPSNEIGLVWPPSMVSPFNPMAIPLLNTIILISSGVTLTESHHLLMEGEEVSSLKLLMMTVFLGGYFTFAQGVEYMEAPFTLADSIYGSTFFIATGFHGLHVLIGTMLLGVMCLRIKLGHFSSNHHMGFEAAAWYWHFVDVVWLFLYVSIYWWGV